MARGMAYKVRPSIGQERVEPPYPGLHWDLWAAPRRRALLAGHAPAQWHYIWNYGNGEIGNQGVHPRCPTQLLTEMGEHRQLCGE